MVESRSSKAQTHERNNGSGYLALISALSFLEEKWLDMVLPEALKLASQMAFDGKSEAEIISASNTIAKVAIQVGSTILSSTTNDPD